MRNWDYRYCWLRDATITLEALLRTGYTDEAAAWRQWLGRAIAGDPADIQIMYGVAGERRLAEWEAAWLPGYEDSAPVRIGNAAVGQLQLDVYGEVIDALQLSCKAGLHDDQHTWSLQRALLDFLEEHWGEPDEGLWEVRGPRRHFRALQGHGLGRLRPRGRTPGSTDKRLARRALAGDPRRDPRARCARRATTPSRGAFTQYYGATELDAAVLLISDVGFLPADDPRVVSTIEVICSGI